MKKLLAIFWCTVFCSTWSFAQTGAFGTVENIDEDRNIFIISGSELQFNPNEVEIVYQDVIIDFTFLQPELSVRYEVNNEGFVTRVTLIGPARALEGIFNN